MYASELRPDCLECLSGNHAAEETMSAVIAQYSSSAFRERAAAEGTPSNFDHGAMCCGFVWQYPKLGKTLNCTRLLEAARHLSLGHQSNRQANHPSQLSYFCATEEPVRHEEPCVGGASVSLAISHAKARREEAVGERGEQWPRHKEVGTGMRNYVLARKNNTGVA